jgi:hypothetical protein
VTQDEDIAQLESFLTESAHDLIKECGGLRCFLSLSNNFAFDPDNVNVVYLASEGTIFMMTKNRVRRNSSRRTSESGRSSRTLSESSIPIFPMDDELPGPSGMSSNSSITSGYSTLSSNSSAIAEKSVKSVPAKDSISAESKKPLCKADNKMNAKAPEFKSLNELAKSFLNENSTEFTPESAPRKTSVSSQGSVEQMATLSAQSSFEEVHVNEKDGTSLSPVLTWSTNDLQSNILPAAGWSTEVIAPNKENDKDASQTQRSNTFETGL